MFLYMSFSSCWHLCGVCLLMESWIIGCVRIQLQELLPNDIPMKSNPQCMRVPSSSTFLPTFSMEILFTFTFLLCTFTFLCAMESHCATIICIYDVEHFYVHWSLQYLFLVKRHFRMLSIWSPVLSFAKNKSFYIFQIQVTCQLNVLPISSPSLWLNLTHLVFKSSYNSYKLSSQEKNIYNTYSNRC